MIEVFKTDVTDLQRAKMLIDRIQEVFAGHQANFDLEDCDRILRIKANDSVVQSSQIIALLLALGVKAEILPDDASFIGQEELAVH